MCWYSQDLRLFCKVAKSICSKLILKPYCNKLSHSHPWRNRLKPLDFHLGKHTYIAQWMWRTKQLSKHETLSGTKLLARVPMSSNNSTCQILLWEYENTTLFSKHSWKSVFFPALHALLLTLARVALRAWLLLWTWGSQAFFWSSFVAHADPDRQQLKLR